MEPNLCRAIVWHAVREGLLPAEDACVLCGGEGTLYHHPDYKRPLFVRRYCGSCHAQVHAGTLIDPATDAATHNLRPWQRSDGGFDLAIRRGAKTGKRPAGMPHRTFRAALTARGLVDTYEAAVAKRTADIAALTTRRRSRPAEAVAS